MITAKLTTRTVKDVKVEIIGTNDYLQTKRFQVRTIYGEKIFAETNSEGQNYRTDTGLVTRGQLDDIRKNGEPFAQSLQEN